MLCFYMHFIYIYIDFIPSYVHTFIVTFKYIEMSEIFCIINWAKFGGIEIAIFCLVSEHLSHIIMMQIIFVKKVS